VRCGVVSFPTDLCACQDACCVPVFELEEVLPLKGKNGRDRDLATHAAERQMLGKREGTDGSLPSHVSLSFVRRMDRGQLTISLSSGNHEQPRVSLDQFTCRSGSRQRLEHIPGLF